MAEGPEAKVKRQVKLFLKSLGAWYYMPVQNGMGVTGVPDFICCIDGRFIGIETKAPGRESSTTANQDRQIEMIHTANGCAVVISNVDQLKEYLRDNGFNI